MIFLRSVLTSQTELQNVIRIFHLKNSHDVEPEAGVMTIYTLCASPPSNSYVTHWRKTIRQSAPSEGPSSITVNEPPIPSSSTLPLHLRIHTDLPPLPQQEDQIEDQVTHTLCTPVTSPGERLSPSRLRVNQFGSRFLPHAESRIRCLLPLMNDRLLLIGHDEGLSVLDMFPREWSDTGSITIKGPDEAKARLMWQGEA